jgi:bacteriocin-like protein
MTKLDNEVCELTTSELNEVSGGGGISIDFGYATVTMAWGAGGCKMAGVTTNDGHTTWVDNGKC